MFATLENMLTRFLATMTDTEVNALAIVTSLRMLLQELAKEVNNTDANCRFINNTIMWKVVLDDSVQERISGLPDPLKELIEDCGMLLHDTHFASEIARNFQSTPSQLLERAIEIEKSLSK